MGGRGERGGSSGGLKGSTRSISVRIGGGGMKSSSSSGMSIRISAASSSASSAFDKWSTMPAPKESPTTLMEVRILSLGGQTVSVSASEITTKKDHQRLNVKTEKALEEKLRASESSYSHSTYQTPDSQQPVDSDEQADVLSRQTHGCQDEQHRNQSSTGNTGSSNTGQGGSHTEEGKNEEDTPIFRKDLGDRDSKALTHQLNIRQLKRTVHPKKSN